MIGRLQQHFGFTKMPFGRDLAPGMLHRHAAHNEAVARITWCIREGAIGVITGEAGAGKTAAARAAAGGIDRTRHHVIYIANPTTGVPMFTRVTEYSARAPRGYTVTPY